MSHSDERSHPRSRCACRSLSVRRHFAWNRHIQCVEAIPFFAAYVLSGHPKTLHHGIVTPGSDDIANYETLRADNAALREKVKSTEALLIALQRAYKTKADELESWAQFRLSKEEEADQRQSVVLGSGGCSSYGRRVEF